jgi:hypothetical protein
MSWNKNNTSTLVYTCFQLNKPLWLLTIKILMMENIKVKVFLDMMPCR